MKRVGMLLCFAMFLSLGAARGQQSPSQQGSGEGEQTPGAAAGQKSTTREPRRGEGIVADNLDRVAATAEQILDVLNRDAGLMVELKRAIAQDAGESGQILEESDLSEPLEHSRPPNVPRIRDALHAVRLLKLTARSTIHARKCWQPLRMFTWTW